MATDPHPLYCDTQLEVDNWITFAKGCLISDGTLEFRVTEYTVKKVTVI